MSSGVDPHGVFLGLEAPDLIPKEILLFFSTVYFGCQWNWVNGWVALVFTRLACHGMG